MLTLEEMTEKIERDYLNMVIQFLKDGTFEEGEIKEITKEFLTLRPFTTTEEAQTKLKNFTTTYPEFNVLYVHFLKLSEEVKTQDLLSKMRSHLKDADIDGALKLIPKKN